MKGRALENAVGAAAKKYEREGRAFVKHNATPMRRYDGEWRFAEKADADFSGPLSGGGFFAGECKEVHDELFNIFNERAGLKPHQRDRLEKTARVNGSLSGVIIGFLGMSPWEVYFVPIVELVPFLDAPWRRSVNVAMCRAMGLLLPLGASAAGKPLVRFLDGMAHPLKNEAIAAMNVDRLAHPYEVELERPVRARAEKPLTGRGSPFDLLEIAKRARRLGGRTKKKWSGQ